MPAYAARDLRMQGLICVHMLMACVRGTCSKTLTQKHKIEKQNIKENPNSNNLAYL